MQPKAVAISGVSLVLIGSLVAIFSLRSSNEAAGIFQSLPDTCEELRSTGDYLSEFVCSRVADSDDWDSDVPINICNSDPATPITFDQLYTIYEDVSVASDSKATWAAEIGALCRDQGEAEPSKRRLNQRAWKRVGKERLNRKLSSTLIAKKVNKGAVMDTDGERKMVDRNSVSAAIAAGLSDEGSYDDPEGEPGTTPEPEPETEAPEEPTVDMGTDDLSELPECLSSCIESCKDSLTVQADFCTCTSTCDVSSCDDATKDEFNRNIAERCSGDGRRLRSLLEKAGENKKVEEETVGRKLWGHGHNPHGHNPHGHNPHGHNPHGHNPHGHNPHTHHPGYDYTRAQDANPTYRGYDNGACRNGNPHSPLAMPGTEDMREERKNQFANLADWYNNRNAGNRFWDCWQSNMASKCSKNGFFERKSYTIPDIMKGSGRAAKQVVITERCNFFAAMEFDQVLCSTEHKDKHFRRAIASLTMGNALFHGSSCDGLFGQFDNIPTYLWSALFVARVDPNAPTAPNGYSYGLKNVQDDIDIMYLAAGKPLNQWQGEMNKLRYVPQHLTNFAFFIKRTFQTCIPSCIQCPVQGWPFTEWACGAWHEMQGELNDFIGTTVLNEVGGLADSIFGGNSIGGAAAGYDVSDFKYDENYAACTSTFAGYAQFIDAYICVEKLPGAVEVEIGEMSWQIDICQSPESLWGDYAQGSTEIDSRGNCRKMAHNNWHLKAGQTFHLLDIAATKVSNVHREGQKGTNERCNGDCDCASAICIYTSDSFSSSNQQKCRPNKQNRGDLCYEHRDCSSNSCKCHGKWEGPWDSIWNPCKWYKCR